MKSFAVLTSGGDSPGMNAALRAVVRSCVYNNVRIYGIDHGYKGIFDGQIHEMNRYSVADIIHKGGTVLYTDRCKEMTSEGGAKRAAELLSGYGIDGLIAIGGDGTYKGALALSEYGINVMTIPGTIDNDIPCTDYCIGYDTALNTAVEAIGKIRDTSSSHNRINVVQVMGRNCGNLALYSGLAGGAEAIVVPEIPFSAHAVAEKIMLGKEKGKMHSIVVFAEGCGNAVDFCHKLEEITQIETRVTILGYTQRGGSPTAFDRILASRMGAYAVELLLAGEKNKAICLKDNHYMGMDLKQALSMEYSFDESVYQTAIELSI